MEAYEPPAEKLSIDTKRKFTNEEVWEMRRRFKGGETLSALAREFNVSKPCMASAVRGLGTYKDV